MKHPGCMIRIVASRQGARGEKKGLIADKIIVQDVDCTPPILLMAEILHQLIGSFSHYL